MTPTKQTVYLKEIHYYDWLVKSHNDDLIDHVKQQEGYFFTSEQLNEYTQRIIKQALQTAAENVSLLEDGKKVCYPRYIIEEGNHYNQTEIDVDKQSITNTFEEIFQSFKV